MKEESKSNYGKPLVANLFGKVIKRKKMEVEEFDEYSSDSDSASDMVSDDELDFLENATLHDGKPEKNVNFIELSRISKIPFLHNGTVTTLDLSGAPPREIDST